MSPVGVRALSLLLTALLPACGPSEPEQNRLSGIIITLDTTNRPALGVYGKRKSTTPNLDALARESLVYDRARTVAPVTLPSHSSMLTGLYPIRHQVRDNGLIPLSASAETLAEQAQEQGYQTGAFVSTPILSAPFGLTQGFDVYDAENSANDTRSAKATTRSAIAWLDRLDRSRPFLLWVHYYDPHAPYQPEAQYLQQVARDGKAVFAEYLAEIAQMDASIGDLLKHLRQTGLLDRSLLAVVADHGESLGRNGELTHSFLAYDTVIRVPMMLRYPDGYRAGERSDEIVSVIDILPTFTNGLALRGVQNIDGENLFKHQVSPDRGVYFESFVGYLNCGWGPLSGWADSRGTYLHGPVPEYYAAQDEHQSQNIIADSEALVRESRAHISRLADRPKLAKAEAALDEDLRAQIQELGYLAQGDPSDEAPHPLAQSDLPSPQQHIEDVTPYLKATHLVREGKPAEALDILRQALSQTPENSLASLALGGMLAKDGKLEEALPHLQNVLDRQPWNRAAIGIMGQSLEDLNRPKEALQYYLSGYDYWAGDPRFGKAVVRMLELLGLDEEAARFREKLRG